MKFTPTNHHNRCAICADTSGDCRTADSLILCHDFIAQDAGLAGWKWVKTSSNGVWGVHVPDSGKQFDREQYERYRRQKQAQELDRQQFLANNALDANNRDRAIRRLSSRVGLSLAHRQALQERGLTEAQIEQGLFFSIDPLTRFNLFLPENLPGISYQTDGNSRAYRFSTKDSGYACPAFDQKGRVIGWQLRIEGVTKGNKYKWAKSRFSSHLANGELPITIVRPHANRPSRLYLCEGILKPLIASNRLDIAVCGAAGGYFRGSPQQLAEIVADYQEIVVVPDAGDVLNPQVMRRIERQIDYLKRFNRPIEVLWWGQIKKDQHQDLDEIDAETFNNAEYLSPSKFVALAKKQRNIAKQWLSWRQYKQFTAQLKVHQRFIEYSTPSSGTITFVKSGLGTGKTARLIKILEQLKDYGIIGLGYRNTLLLQFNEKAKSLGFYHLQSDKKLREFNLEDPTLNVTNCLDSLIHFDPEQFNRKIVIIDEIMSVIKHLLFSPTIKQFIRVKQLFTEIINRADRVICLDAFLADWAANFFREICPSKSIVTIENTYSGDKAKVYLLEGTIDPKGKLRVNDKTPWLEKLLNSDLPAICSDSQIFGEALDNLLMEQGRRGIRVDSKTVADQHIKEFFINPNQYIQEHRPEYVIYSPSAESGLDIPTTSYFTEHFSFFFGLLDIDSCHQMLGRIRDIGVSKYLWCKQFVAASDTNKRSSNLKTIQAERYQLLMEEIDLTLSSIESSEAKIARLRKIYEANLDPYTTAADTITAIRHHEFANYRACLKLQLINNGYSLEAFTPSPPDAGKEIAQVEKKAKTEVKQQNSRDIYNASDRYIDQDAANPPNTPSKPNNQLNSTTDQVRFDASWSTRCALIKAGLVKKLPGIHHHRVWSPDFIKKVKYDRPNLIKQTELYYWMNNLDLAKQLALEKYNQIFNRGTIAAPWKLRQNYLKAKALRDIGLHQFIQRRIARPDLGYCADSPEVVEMLLLCRQKPNRDVLGKPGVDAIKYLNQLIRGVGIETRSHKVKRDGKTVSVYFLDQQHLLSEERQAILESIQLKYAQKINSPTQPLHWVAIEENLPEFASVDNWQQKNSETTARHDLDQVALYPENYINNSTKCNPPPKEEPTAHPTPEPHNTSEIQEPLDSDSAVNSVNRSKSSASPMPVLPPAPLSAEPAGISIAEDADMLASLENAQQLAELITTVGFSPTRLNQAARRLSLRQQQRLRQWLIENRPSTA